MHELHNTNSPTIKGLAALFQDEYRYSQFFRDDSAAHLMTELMAKRTIEQADAGHEASYFWSGDSLEGVVLRYPKNFTQFGFEGDELVVALRPHSQAAVRWAQARILSMRWSKTRNTVGKLSGFHQELLPTIYQVGLGIDAIGLMGATQPAFDYFEGTNVPNMEVDSLGLSCMPLDETRVDDVVLLRERTFRQVPEYCWFGANPGHLETHRLRLLDDLKKPHAWFILLKDDAVVGHFGSAVTPNNPMWGPTGGLELYFDEDFRGIGLGKYAYHRTLSALLKHEVQVFKGITAQPPVMYLSQRMGRQLFEIHLRNDPDFSAAHFSPYLDS